MHYYFIKGAVTQYGPLNFAVASQYNMRQEQKLKEDLRKKVNQEALKRGVYICHNWESEKLSEQEWENFVNGLDVI